MNKLNRRLLHKESTGLDLTLTLDVEEYLIEEWPTLNATQRKSVWAMASNDEDFDWSDIQDQIDDYVGEILQEEFDDEEDEDEEWSELDNCVWVDIYEHLDAYDGDDLDEMVEYIQEKFDYTAVYEQIELLQEKFLSRIDPSNDSLKQGPAE